MTDLYCDHDRFLPTVRWSTPGRLALALTWRILVCVAFVVGARQLSPLPVYVATSSLGTALLALPLRRFPIAGPAATLTWLVFCAVVPLVLFASDATNVVVSTAIVCATFVVWMVSFARFAFDEDAKSQKAAGAVFISTLAIAAACSSVVGLTFLPYLEPVFELPASMREPLVTISMSALAAAVLVALAGGVSRAADRGPTDPPRDMIKAPHQPAIFERPARRRRVTLGTSRDIGTIVLRAVAMLADQVGMAARMIGALTVHTLKWLVYWTVHILVSVANALWRWIYYSGRVVVDGVNLAWAALRRSVRVVAIPFVSLLVGAYLVYTFARENLAYLTTGSVHALGVSLGCLAGAALAVTVAWMALGQDDDGPEGQVGEESTARRGGSFSENLRSAVMTLSASGASLLILTALGGWAIGLFGTFGNGPIRVGWVTLASTAILVVTALWSAIRNRRRGDSVPDEAVAPQQTSVPV